MLIYGANEANTTLIVLVVLLMSHIIFLTHFIVVFMGQNVQGTKLLLLYNSRFIDL